ncbi:hypothetical protein FA10DRAFT_304657 [Acaromyces ingoldii]|uniref:Zn(2)-C6 fungal-type domain-containing protein n=1 Tax=Acaromyces ingoldii TaxID=215250 RepID=A0A316YG61_9BASI|nr:hypothetical protein FA10DRAFT_304657 [Acaromyces ingoldii]PWN86735.1 hypothetical protein FA10DRAFT_304657 [Acaromyces ingoldii]
MLKRQQFTSCDPCRKGKRACDARLRTDGSCSNCTKTAQYCTFGFVSRAKRVRRESNPMTEIVDESSDRESSCADREQGSTYGCAGPALLTSSASANRSRRESDGEDRQSSEDASSANDAPGSISSLYSEEISEAPLTRGLEGNPVSRKTRRRTPATTSPEGGSKASRASFQGDFTKAIAEGIIDRLLHKNLACGSGRWQDLTMSMLQSDMRRIYHSTFEHVMTIWVSPLSCPLILQEVKVPKAEANTAAHLLSDTVRLADADFTAADDSSKGSVVAYSQDGNFSDDNHRGGDGDCAKRDGHRTRGGRQGPECSGDEEGTKGSLLSLAKNQGLAQDSETSVNKRVASSSSRQQRMGQTALEMAICAFSSNRIFGREHHMSRMFWRHSKTSLLSVIDDESLNASLASFLFAFTPRPKGEEHDEAEITCGDPTLLDIALRRMHVWLHQKRPTAKEQRATRSYRLYYWLAISIDTVSSLMRKRPFVMTGAPIAGVQDFGVMGSCGRRSRDDVPSRDGGDEGVRWRRALDISETFRSYHYPLVALQTWPCDLGSAEGIFSAASLMTVVFMRKVLMLKTGECSLTNCLSLVQQWSLTYEPFMKSCLDSFEALPFKLRAWLLVTLWPWHLSILSMSDTQGRTDVDPSIFGCGYEDQDRDGGGTDSTRSLADSRILVNVRLQSINTIAVAIDKALRSEGGSPLEEHIGSPGSDHFRSSRNEIPILTLDPWIEVPIRAITEAARSLVSIYNVISTGSSSSSSSSGSSGSNDAHRASSRWSNDGDKGPLTREKMVRLLKVFKTGLKAFAHYGAANVEMQEWIDSQIVRLNSVSAREVGVHVNEGDGVGGGTGDGLGQGRDDADGHGDCDVTSVLALDDPTCVSALVGEFTSSVSALQKSATSYQGLDTSAATENASNEYLDTLQSSRSQQERDMRDFHLEEHVHDHGDWICQALREADHSFADSHATVGASSEGYDLTCAAEVLSELLSAS